MRSRGAFINIENDDFSFVVNGQKYHSLYFDVKRNIKYLIQTEGSNKVPDYSHSPNRIYALIQNGKAKSIWIYEDHVKKVSIDLNHKHKNKDGKLLDKHVHVDLFHQEDARTLSQYEEDLVELVEEQIKKIV